jgi:hypothetical protein
MANTEVTLINNQGVYVPSAASVAVVRGDTFSFKTNDGSAVFVFFSPDAMAVLSPVPRSPFPIATGSKAEFSFASSEPGAYSVYFAPEADLTPASFSSARSESLLLEVNNSIVPSFNNQMTTGH